MTLIDLYFSGNPNKFNASAHLANVRVASSNLVSCSKKQEPHRIVTRWGSFRLLALTPILTPILACPVGQWAGPGRQCKYLGLKISIDRSCESSSIALGVPVRPQYRCDAELMVFSLLDLAHSTTHGTATSGPASAKSHRNLGQLAVRYLAV